MLGYYSAYFFAHSLPLTCIFSSSLVDFMLLYVMCVYVCVSMHLANLTGLYISVEISWNKINIIYTNAKLLV